MAAPRGNKFWKARSSHGRKPKFSDADVLWGAINQYFEWVEDNPLWEEKIFSYQGETHKDVVHKMRAMTIAGMCTFLDVTQETWDNYREKKDLFEVTKKAERIIRDQKFSGAAADLLNANIIARDLGLTDKGETKHSGAVGVIDLTEKTDEELKAIIKGE